MSVQRAPGRGHVGGRVPCPARPPPHPPVDSGGQPVQVERLPVAQPPVVQRPGRHLPVGGQVGRRHRLAGQLEHAALHRVAVERGGPEADGGGGHVVLRLGHGGGGPVHGHARRGVAVPHDVHGGEVAVAHDQAPGGRALAVEPVPLPRHRGGGLALGRGHAPARPRAGPTGTGRAWSAACSRPNSASSRGSAGMSPIMRSARLVPGGRRNTSSPLPPSAPARGSGAGKPSARTASTQARSRSRVAGGEARTTRSPSARAGRRRAPIRRRSAQILTSPGYSAVLMTSSVD